VAGGGGTLRARWAEAGDERDEGAERAAADHEEPVPEGVAHAFPHPAHTADVELRDARSGVGHLDQLGNRVEADRDGHEPDAVPEEELTEGVPLDARDWIEPDRGQPETEAAGEQALHERFAAERGDERDAEDGQ